MTWSSDWRGGLAAGIAADVWTPADLAKPDPVSSRGAGAQPTASPHAAEAERAAEEANARAARQAELEEAWNQGFDAGIAEADQQQGQRVASALAALQSALAAVHAEQSLWVADAREHIIALATAVARHVIGRELRGDPHVIADVTRRALAHFPANEPVRVRVNPEDLSLLSTAISPDGGNIPVAPGRDVRWAADPAIEPGGCIVEGRRRVVDGRVDHALERIFQRLADD